MAIVGLGPKGLFALERLLHHARPHAALDVDLFEPHAVPGAGPVYDPGQPAYLRMNLAADRLSVWCDGSRAVAAGERLSFSQWRARDGDGAQGGERFPPRAQVGRYLADALAAMRRGAPPWVRIVLHRSTAVAARPAGDGWRVVADDGTADDYDEVLLAVGHRPGSDPWPPGAWQHAAPLIPAVFPVTERLAPERVTPGARVAVRGFALTFIDAALALTQGRGGVFQSDGHPYRVRYLESARDAGLILPFSRSGRPMLAKPEPDLAASLPALETIADAGRAEILALPPAFDLHADLLAILASAVAASLLAATGQARTGERLDRATRSAARWLAAACDGEPTVAEPGEPAAELERSLAVGAGLVAPDLPWALGHTWRSLYPAIVARLSGTGMPARAWPAFRRLAAQLERLAFGPPAVNAAKLLALVEAGRVDLTYVAAGRVATTAGTTVMRLGGLEQPVDVVVNAVLAGPGVRESDDGLLAELLAGGHVRVARSRRGIEVAGDGACIGRSGDRTPGLSAIGRPTEDSVIGNDTLSRALHPHADRWARRVVQRSAGRAPANETPCQAA